MAAPPKPWEIAGVNQQNAGSIPVNNMSGLPLSSGGSGGLPPCCQPSASVAAGPPPPVPTRPSQQTGLSRFSSPYGYSSPYSSMGSMGMYGGGYSPYSSYGGGYGGGYSGGYGGGYGQYGAYGGQGEYNSFARQAEENSRQAFQSVESIVGAFTSVSMMLDSTFQAVYSSFRAVLGVADNFSRLKNQLSSVFQAFALFKLLRYIYRKFLVLLRLRPSMETDEAWNQAASSVLPGPEGDGPKKSTWPIMLFLGIIMAGPYLIWRLISGVTQNTGEKWMNGEDDHFVAAAQYNYKGDSDNELSFEAGQEIKVAPKELQPRMKGWLLASVDGQKTGIIPGNYVKILGKRQGTRKVTQVPMETQDVAPTSSCKKSETPSKSCCSSKSQNHSMNPLENPLNQNLDNMYAENQTIDNNTSPVLDNMYNTENPSEMDAGDIVDKCHE